MTNDTDTRTRRHVANTARDAAGATVAPFQGVVSKSRVSVVSLWRHVATLVSAGRAADTLRLGGVAR